MAFRRHGFRNDGQAGGALVLSLLAVLVVAALAGSYMELSSSISKRQGRAADRKQSFYMAEAGLSEAFTGMWIGKTGNVGTSEAPAAFGKGLFWVEAEELGDGVHRLESTGMYGGGRATLAVVVQEGGESVASLGVFSEDPLVVPDGTRFDRYDSDVGTYDEQWDANGDWIGAGPELVVDVGSNNGITVEETSGDTIIKGNATPGESSSVTEVGDPEITGVTLPRVLNSILPLVDVPGTTIGSGVNHSSGTPYTISPGEHGYAFLRVHPGAQMVVTGPATIVVGDLLVRNTAELQFDTTTGPVELFVTGELDLRTGSVVTMTDDDPAQLTIQVSGATPGDLHCAGQFFGSVYAPLATLNVAQSFELFGSLIAKELVIAAGAKLHYDQYVASVDAKSTLPAHRSWRILDFSPIGSSEDPYKNVGVVKGSLTTPDKSHQDQWLDVTYTDLSGTTQTYSGLESGFDWAQVKEVADASRDGETTEMMNTKGQNTIFNLK